MAELNQLLSVQRGRAPTAFSFFVPQLPALQLPLPMLWFGVDLALVFVSQVSLLYHLLCFACLLLSYFCVIERQGGELKVSSDSETGELKSKREE